MNDGAILLVEDNDDDRELTRRAVSRHNPAQTIHLVPDLESANDFFAERGAFSVGPNHRPPVLILLDLKMPRMDGIDLLRRFRRHKATRLVPIVVLTSSRERSDITAAYEAGANGYISKPVEFDRFVQVIQSVCRYWLECNEH